MYTLIYQQAGRKRSWSKQLDTIMSQETCSPSEDLALLGVQQFLVSQRESPASRVVVAESSNGADVGSEIGPTVVFAGLFLQLQTIEGKDIEVLSLLHKSPDFFFSIAQ